MRILQSKLQPPKRPDILHRERLARLFDPVDHTTLFTVLAGAGFGKTTLVADVLSSRGMAFAWYRLDRQDTDFHVFISYLYGMIGPAASEGGSAGREAPVNIPGTQRRDEALIDWLGHLEDRIRRPFALVLDDYHLVQDSDVINRAVAFILGRLPSHIHLIIVGRKRLPLALSRLRSQGRLQEICQQELAFSGDEINAFFEGHAAVTRAHLDQIATITGGWAASLVLLRYACQRRSAEGITDHLRGIEKKPPDYIFSYLKENVFDLQPESVKDFMMKAALLPEIEVSFCERIFNVDDAAGMLNRMIENHLLLFPVDDSGRVFYLHHLFRDFLLARLVKEYPAPEICRLHCRIAEAVEPSDAARALYHFIEGRDYDRAVSVTLSHESEFLLHGKILFIGRQIEKLPETHIRRHPRLLLFLSRLYSHYGEPEKAIELISTALTLFKDRDDKGEMVSCVIELASQYYFTGHPAEAMKLMEQVLDDIDPGSQTYIIAMTFLTFLPSVLGKFDIAGLHDQKAREVVSGYPEFEKKVATALLDTSLGHTLYFKGEFEASQHLCRHLLKRVQALTVDPCLPLVYFQLSANSYYLGRYEEGCTYAGKGIAACERMSLADSRKAWVYYAWALNCLGLNHLDAVFDKLAAATPLFEEPGNRWGLASIWDCLAQAYQARHNTAMAKKILDKALAVIQGYGLTVTRGIVKNTYAAVLMAEEDYDAALDLLSQAGEDLKDAAFHRFNNALLEARARFYLGSRPAAADLLTRAAALSMTHAYDRFMVREGDWIVPLLRAAPQPESRGIRPKVRPYLETLFREELNRFPRVLNIGLLGEFALSVSDRVIGPADWKSAKALMLLKYLAARRSRGYVHREHLMELLWPDEDPGKTAARFNMAMSALRKTLEPRIAPRAPSSFIDRKKDAYRLFDDQRIIIDTERFASLLAEAKAQPRGGDRQISCLLGAIRLYRGDFLKEDPYEDWCLEIREAFLRDYTGALRDVIPALEQREEAEEALACAEKWFQNDPLNEAAARKLMSLYAGQDEHSAVSTTYDRHVRTARDHGLPVSETLTAFHRNLLKP